MSIEETYDWAKRVREDFQSMAEQDVTVGTLNKELTQGGDHQFQSVEFAQIERPSYRGEVGRVDGDGDSVRDLIFHFFPVNDEKYCDLLGVHEDEEGNKLEIWGFRSHFPDVLATAFLEVFKQEDKLCWDNVPELQSWVVRCTGFGDNLMANELAEKLFGRLSELLET